MKKTNTKNIKITKKKEIIYKKPENTYFKVFSFLWKELKRLFLTHFPGQIKRFTGKKGKMLCA